MEIKLPLNVDWELAEETYAEPRLLFQAGIRRSVKSVVDESDLGRVAYVDMNRDSVIIFTQSIDYDKAERLWKTGNRKFLLQMIAERETRAADAYLRSSGMGGVKGCQPSWSRSGNYQPKDGETGGYEDGETDGHKSMFVHLYNGWEDPDECAETCSAGEDGPVLGPFNYVQLTYGGHLKMRQCRDEVENPMADLTVGEFTYYDGMWYGDIFVFTRDEDEVISGGGYEQWDPGKAHPTRDQRRKHERCSECGKEVCFEAHTQDDPPEYEVCAGCSRNTCPDCTTYEGEEPLCPSCVSEPVDELIGVAILRDLRDYDVKEIRSLTCGLFGDLNEASHSKWVFIAQMCLGKAQQLHRIGCTILDHTNVKGGDRDGR